MIKIALWGIGKGYNIVFNILKFYEYQKKIEITGIIDTNAYMHTLDGYKVVKPREISKLDFQYIIITSENSFDDIVREAVYVYGINRKVLIPHRVFFIPNINLDEYLKLYESEISIISNNCWGGIICNTLSLECRSPFKNMFLRNEEYLKVISNLEEYMMADPIFVRYEEEIHSHINYPVIRINDIEIHCNHYIDYKVAIDDWNRRKEKINYKNLFFEMYTVEKNVAKKFLELTKDKKSVCFVPWKSNDKKAITLPLFSENIEFYESVNVNATINTNGLKYDLISVLQGTPILRY